ncbi:GspH/FimT family protein [Paucibacter soli]|uniref:GspH/FimT family protein n=1 Tax=Paucibacter soli TaxID=3133433 RepID=UPI0030AC59CC
MMLPEVTNWVRGISVRNSGESIKAGIERARMEALRRNTSMSLWLVTDPTGKNLTNACALDSNGTSWVVSGMDPGGKCAASPSATALPLLVERWASSDGANAVKVSATDANGDAADHVSFTSLGQVSPAPGSATRIDIEHAKGGRSLRVTIDVGGAVRLCDPGVGADDPRRC